MQHLNDIVIQPATINKDEYLFLGKYVSGHDIKTVLEFGPGISTWAFLDSGCKVSALEGVSSFFDYDVEQFKFYDVDMYLYVDSPVIVMPALDGKRFDMAFVDAPSGHRRNFARLNSCMFASKYTNRILLHDSHRIGEIMTQMVFAELGWVVLEIYNSPRGIAEMTL